MGIYKETTTFKEKIDANLIKRWGFFGALLDLILCKNKMRTKNWSHEFASYLAPGELVSPEKGRRNF